MKIKWCILIIGLLLLSSCSGFGNIRSYFGGREGAVGGRGVILKFIDAPDNNQILYENEIFPLGIEIENHVPGNQGLVGELCVRDTLSGSYGGIPENECLPVNLPPAQDIDGKITQTADSFQFGPYSYNGLEEAYSQPSQILADLKYQAESTAFSSTCVKRLRAQSPTIPANCGKKQDIRVQQPDLPIDVSRLTTSASSTDLDAILRMEIILRKVREGQVVSSESIYSQAQPGTARIRLEVSANQQPANCLGGGIVEFRQNENEKKVVCTINVPLDSDHIDVPISIKMSYGFIQSIIGPTLELRKGENLA